MPNSLAIAAANLPGLPISAAGAVLPQSGVADFSALLLSLTPPQFQAAGTPTAATEKPAKAGSPVATIDVSMDPSRLLYMGGTIPANLAGTPNATTTSTAPTNSGSQTGPSSQSLEELPLQQFDVRSIQIETELLPQSLQAVLPQTTAGQPVLTTPGAFAGLQFSKYVPAVNATLTPDASASQNDATGAQPITAVPTAPTVTKAGTYTTGTYTKGTESKSPVLSDLVLATQSKNLAEAAPQEKSANMTGNQHAKFVPEPSTVSVATHTTETVLQALTAAGTGSTTQQDATLQSRGTTQTALVAPKGSDSGQPEVTDFVQAPDTPQYSPSAQNPQNTSATASAIALDAKTVVLKAGGASDFGSRDSSKDSDDPTSSSSQPVNAEAVGAPSHSTVFAADGPAATTFASKAPQAAAPAPAAPRGEAGWAPQVPVAARRVSIDVGEGDSSVRITIHERAGDISVKIDSATDTMHGQLQSSAGTLVDALRREQVPLANLDFSSMPDNSSNPDQRRQRNPNSPKSPKAAAQSDPAILGDSVTLQS